MEFKIIMPFRPLTDGSCTCPSGEIRQLQDGMWEAEQESIHNKKYVAEKRITIDQAIATLNRYSAFKHKIIVVLDSDVFPNENFLKQFDNVTIMKSSYMLDQNAPQPHYLFRMPAATRDGFMTLTDEDWFCYIYLDDWICCKGWDKFIVDAIDKYGDNCVYAPMFVEPYSGLYRPNVDFTNEEATFEKVWDFWHREVCCHSLTMPIPGIGYIEEKWFEDFVKKVSRNDLMIEPCGVRAYGYYAGMIMKAKHAKAIGMNIGPGWDTDFDGRLYSVLGLKKVVVTNSFILHTKYQKFKFNEDK